MIPLSQGTYAERWQTVTGVRRDQKQCCPGSCETYLHSREVNERRVGGGARCHWFVSEERLYITGEPPNVCAPGSLALSAILFLAMALVWTDTPSRRFVFVCTQTRRIMEVSVSEVGCRVKSQRNRQAELGGTKIINNGWRRVKTIDLITHLCRLTINRFPLKSPSPLNNPYQSEVVDRYGSFC